MGIEKVIIGGFVAAVAGLICLVVVASAAEQKQWDAFAATHECKLVEYRKGDLLVTTATTIGPNGKVSVSSKGVTLGVTLASNVGASRV